MGKWYKLELSKDEKTLFLVFRGEHKYLAFILFLLWAGFVYNTWEKLNDLFRRHPELIAVMAIAFVILSAWERERRKRREQGRDPDQWDGT